mmetsp:Transcript_75607/g.214193  ORF Transcript_75607/g.214193 Transcript_75607/m.214193 type:complete len:305 (+) Transcript_75607:307-1221(+)
MLPASRLGNTSTLALPATAEPGAFDSPTLGTIAASSCSSPSQVRPGRRCLSRGRASRTLSTAGSEAEPLVLNESSATRGSRSANSAEKFEAARSAISASSCELGLTITAQSAKKSGSRPGGTITKKLLILEMPFFMPTICTANRTTSPEEVTAPDTLPWATPPDTRRLAKPRGWVVSGSFLPARLRASSARSASAWGCSSGVTTSIAPRSTPSCWAKASTLPLSAARHTSVTSQKSSERPAACSVRGSVASGSTMRLRAAAAAARHCASQADRQARAVRMLLQAPEGCACRLACVGSRSPLQST